MGEQRFAFDPQDPPARVTRWIARMEKVIAAQPKDTWLFVASGSPLLLVTDPDGERVSAGLTFDQDAVVASFSPPVEWDGGDF